MELKLEIKKTSALVRQTVARGGGLESNLEIYMHLDGKTKEELTTLYGIITCRCRLPKSLSLTHHSRSFFPSLPPPHPPVGT